VNRTLQILGSTFLLAAVFAWPPGLAGANARPHRHASNYSANLLKDINPIRDRFIPTDVAQWGSNVVFTAVFYDGYISTESLWETDGTPAGTHRFTIPGNPKGFPSHITPVGDRDFFVESYGGTGPQLWVSDGTAGGTTSLATFHRDTDLFSMVQLGGDLYFITAVNYDHYFLWKSDGTAAGTQEIARIPEHISVRFYPLFARDAAADAVIENHSALFAGTISPNKSDAFFLYDAPRLVVAGSRIFVSAGDKTTGRELWSSDGTTAGTGLVDDINAGKQASTPSDLVSLGSDIYFTADDGVNGRQLWKSDGTAAGTQMVTSIPHGDAENLTASGNLLIFSDLKPCLTPSGICHDKTLGPGLWVSDGTPGGTMELHKAAVSNIYNISSGASTRVIFTVDRYVKVPHKRRYREIQSLWTSDGTAAGTQQLPSIDPGANSRISPPVIVGTGGTTQALFAATDPVAGRELWTTDGTAAGTHILRDIHPGGGSSNPSNLTVVVLGGHPEVLFSADDGTHGPQLWQTDGTTAGTTTVRLLNVTTASSNPGDFVPVGNGLDFVALGPTSRGSENATENIYRLTGPTAASIRLLGPLQSGYWSSQPQVATGQFGVYPCHIKRHRFSLCRMGVSPATTGVFTTITVPGKRGFTWPEITAAGGHVYVSSGRRLWTTDGTVAGTKLILTLPAKSGMAFTNVGGTPTNLLFFVYEHHKSQQVWQSDGTSAGTAPQLALSASLRRSHVVDLAVGAGGTIYESMWAPSTGTVLTAGSASQRTKVIALRVLNRLTPVGSDLYFCGQDGLHGTELWIDQGGHAHMLKNIRAGIESSNPRWITPYQNGVIFSAADRAHGREPWVSDGTAAGTHLVSNIAASSTSSAPGGFTVFDGSAFFVAANRSNGVALYVTDGTGSGTSLVRANIGVEAVTAVSGPFVYGDSLYFSSVDAHHGNELWFVPSQ
jgi:ELWxxDGT repeat protein